MKRSNHLIMTEMLRHYFRLSEGHVVVHVARLLQLVAEVDGLMAINQLVRNLVAKAVAHVRLDLAVDGPVALRCRRQDRL
eukprot:4599049-Pleurochrysis_carterae.AAC.2